MWLFTVLSDWLFLDGFEKPSRLFVATMEIAASVLVVIPVARLWGGPLAVGVMSGAIFFHLASPLGIDDHKDGGALFKEARVVWLSAAFILLSYREEASAVVHGLVNRDRRVSA